MKNMFRENIVCNVQVQTDRNYGGVKVYSSFAGRGYFGLFF